MLFSKTISETKAPIKLQLTVEQLRGEMTRFVEHIKALMGVATQSTGSIRIVRSPLALSDWQVNSFQCVFYFIWFIFTYQSMLQLDTIIRSHLFENLLTATETIHSLSLLVDSLKTMTVLDHIKILLEVSYSSRSLYFYFSMVYDIISRKRSDH